MLADQGYHFVAQRPAASSSSAWQPPLVSVRRWAERHVIAPHCELLLGDSRVPVEAIPWQAGGLHLMAAVVLVEVILWQAGGLHLIPAIVLMEAMLCVMLLLWTHSCCCSSAALSLGTTAHRPPSTTLCLHPGHSAHPSAPCVLDIRRRILRLFCVPSPSAHKHS